MKGERLSNRQIATLKQLAVCCSAGGQYALTRDQREAMAPLWRRGLIEIWYRQGVDSNPSLQGPFYRPSEAGWVLIRAVLAGGIERCAA
ncbi:hypothetical protein LPW26_05930 [Rhodopseudomonas sp. HC1]|uniref:hypothetical protein n=1 Tax=Rhodopseudomonas infernalis TaxID=2897386 RepID=UPI001EE8AD2C|nr:hypothetical protein [Rhodopseudomonas infernalis]MCG6204165.1 hypothetical protein [Rhodopseudomonas infernalis]